MNSSPCFLDNLKLGKCLFFGFYRKYYSQKSVSVNLLQQSLNYLLFEFYLLAIYAFSLLAPLDLSKIFTLP